MGEHCCGVGVGGWVAFRRKENRHGAAQASNFSFCPRSVSFFFLPLLHLSEEKGGGVESGEALDFQAPGKLSQPWKTCSLQLSEPWQFGRLWQLKLQAD